MCEEIFDMNRIVLAGLFAAHTANAAYFAGFHDGSAFVAAAAENNCLLFFRNQRKQVFRAGLHAFAAGNAVFRLNHGNAVADAQRIIFAGAHTVAETYAAKAALRRASGYLRGCRAGLDSFILRFVAGIVIAAKAVDNGNMRFQAWC